MEGKKGRQVQTDFLLFLKGHSCAYVAKRADVQFLLEKSAKLQQTGKKWLWQNSKVHAHGRDRVPCW